MEHGEAGLAELLATDPRGYFRRLVEVYQHRLFAFAYRLTGNRQTAEDIVQEAFVRAYVACLMYPQSRVRELNLRPWLYKITLNEFHHLARRSRLHVVPIDLADDSPMLEIEDPSAERPDLIVEGQERARELEAAVVRLPERYRVPITCCYFEHLTYPEIADLLDQPLGTVKSAIFRGVRLLRTMLSAPDRCERDEGTHGPGQDSYEGNEGKAGHTWSRTISNSN